MFKEDDEEEENTFGVTRYACMPSLVALQQMRNRLHLAHLGQKLMKWTALATGRELRKIAIELDGVIQGFGEEMRNAFILIARGRYFCQDLNKIVLENIGHQASVKVVPTVKQVSAVKMIQYEIVETGVPAYAHLGLQKGGQSITEAKTAWLNLLKRILLIMQLRASFIAVDQANKNATKKWNVLSKVVSPRVTLSVRYIISELEEIDREDNFRLKRFKELKIKKSKEDDDDTDKRCYCDKKPGKGDDFICLHCKKEEERRNNNKNKTKSPKTCMQEVIGDKASTLSAANQKRLDDLTAHLEKVISLTSQCKCEGLVSPSIETFIYACKEIRGKIEEIDHQQQTCDSNCTQTPQDVGCSTCGEVKETQNVCCKDNEESKHVKQAQAQDKPCYSCVDALQPKDQKGKEDSFGYFETKFKEIVKVMKSQNEDGTISEEKQVITVKTERKYPNKPNESCKIPCCKLNSFDSTLPFEIKSGEDDKVCCNNIKNTKSQDISSCMNKKQIKDTKSSSSDTKANINSTSCKICDPKPVPPASSESFFSNCSEKCPSLKRSNKSNVSPKCSKTCPSLTGSNKSKVSTKCSKMSNDSQKKKVSKKDESCVCTTEKKSAGCDSIWIDVCCSTSELAEKPEESEEECICIQEAEVEEPVKKVSKHSKHSKSSISSCGKKDIEPIENNSSHTLTIKLCNKKSKESEINGEIKENTSKRCHPCNSNSKINKTDGNSKTCCKIRIISRQNGESKGKDDKVQEVIFFGSILDAIKQILAPGKSDEYVDRKSSNKQPSGKPCSCASIQRDSPAKKSCLKTTASQVSDDIGSSTYVSCKGIEKSQSCPHCKATSEDKAISWSRQRAKSDENTSRHRSRQTIYPKPHNCGATLPSSKNFISKCSLCGSELSKVTRSNTTSALNSISRNPSETDKESCNSCRDETESGSVTDSVQTEEPCPCDTTGDNKSKFSKDSESSLCKICQTRSKSDKSIKQNKSRIDNLSTSQSCPVCFKDKEKTAKDKESERDSCSCKPTETKSLCCGSCKPSEDNKPKDQKESKSSLCKIFQTGSKSNKSIKQEKKPIDNLSASQSCPVCIFKDKEKAAKDKEREHDSCSCKPNVTKSLCCGSRERIDNFNTSRPCPVCYKNKEKAAKDTESERDSCSCKPTETKSLCCGSCVPTEDNKPKVQKESKSSLCKIFQTGSKNDKSTKQNITSQPCPVCFKDKETATNDKETATKDKERERDSCSSKPSATKSLCCADDEDKAPVEMKDAETSTRRSDRYDVRPLSLIKPEKKLSCTCRSDSAIQTRKKAPPKRCKSCSSYYGDL